MQSSPRPRRPSCASLARAHGRPGRGSYSVGSGVSVSEKKVCSGQASKDAPLERLAEEGLHARLLVLGLAPALLELAREVALLALVLAEVGRRPARPLGLGHGQRRGGEGWRIVQDLIRIKDGRWHRRTTDEKYADARADSSRSVVSANDRSSSAMRVSSACIMSLPPAASEASMLSRAGVCCSTTAARCSTAAGRQTAQCKASASVPVRKRGRSRSGTHSRPGAPRPARAGPGPGSRAGPRDSRASCPPCRAASCHR